MEKDIQKKLAELPFANLKLQEPTSRQRVPVLLLLGHDFHNPSFILTKRSHFVPQPGDISCPGGAVEQSVDVQIAAAIRRGAILVYADGVAEETRRSAEVSLFAAAALREANEEIGLSPGNVDIMGVLPPYELRLFAKDIVPLVGKIKEPWQAQVNKEVERVIVTPLSVFFDDRNYVSLEIVHKNGGEFCPALAIPNNAGGEDVLWGATFFIIEGFLRLCFGFGMPDCSKKRVIKRHLDERYLRGENAVRQHR